jgi:hypothetical protein
MMIKIFNILADMFLINIFLNFCIFWRLRLIFFDNLVFFIEVILKSYAGVSFLFPAYVTLILFTFPIILGDLLMRGPCFFNLINLIGIQTLLEVVQIKHVIFFFALTLLY